MGRIQGCKYMSQNKGHVNKWKLLFTASKKFTIKVITLEIIRIAFDRCYCALFTSYIRVAVKVVLINV